MGRGVAAVVCVQAGSSKQCLGCGKEHRPLCVPARLPRAMSGRQRTAPAQLAATGVGGVFCKVGWCELQPARGKSCVTAENRTRDSAELRQAVD